MEHARGLRRGRDRPRAEVRRVAKIGELRAHSTAQVQKAQNWMASEIAKIDAERKLLLVKGAVPGADVGHIVVRPSVKTPAKKGA